MQSFFFFFLEGSEVEMWPSGRMDVRLVGEVVTDFAATRRGNAQANATGMFEQSVGIKHRKKDLTDKIHTLWE